MKYTKYVSSVLVTGAFAALAVAIPLSGSIANAATASVTGSVGGGQGTAHVRVGMWGGQGAPGKGGSGMNGMRPAVFGTVASIDGTSLTVTQGARPSFGTSTPAMATTTYSVDASNATVFKNNATSTISSVLVGDMVAVQGTVSGTDVTATTIRDGLVPMMGRMGMMGSSTGPRGPGGYRNASSTNGMPASPITGNGQPVIAGSISAINGNSLTVTDKSSVSYTVDVTNAKIVEGQNTIAVSNLAVGDNVIIQGSVEGSSVTASSVIDQKAPAAGSNPSSPAPHNGGGIFGAIGGFFSHIFGF